MSNSQAVLDSTIYVLYTYMLVNNVTRFSRRISVSVWRKTMASLRHFRGRPCFYRQRLRRRKLQNCGVQLLLAPNLGKLKKIFKKVCSIFEVVEFISLQGHFELSTIFSYCLEGKTILVNKYLPKSLSLSFFLNETIISKTDFPKVKTNRRQSLQ